MKYESGQPISVNTIEALKFIAKVGFINRKIWNEFFSTGKRSWKEKQLALMVKRELLRVHLNPEVRNHWVLTRKAVNLLLDINLQSVSPSSVAQLYHDGVVLHSLLVLSRERYIRDWKTEPELRVMEGKQGHISKFGEINKLPDAIFNIFAFEKERLIAIEYERTRKSPQRYKAILNRYDSLEKYAMVIFICENDGIKTALEREILRCAMASLHTRIAFVMADDWIKYPIDAPFLIAGKITTLKNICNPF